MSEKLPVENSKKNTSGNFSKKIRKRNISLPLDCKAFVKGILAGDHVMLSRAITLVESTRSDHQALTAEIIEACLPFAGKSVRIGISGSPGVGKSSFIEAYGQQLLSKGENLAVLAIDPSSQQSRGSILGDKTRMSKLGTNDQVFIRPSPASDNLGGVSKATRESIILCEAAGFKNIIIETVGVGQSEIAVHSMVDCFLLLLLPGAGDELQGIKRGIVEMADIVVVNKADGDRIKLAKLAKNAYKNALHLFPLKASKYPPKVLTCSALENQGIDEIEKTIADYIQFIQQNAYFDQQRKNQRAYWLKDTINNALLDAFKKNLEVSNIMPTLETKVLEGIMSPFEAARILLEKFGGE